MREMAHSIMVGSWLVCGLTALPGECLALAYGSASVEVSLGDGVVASRSRVPCAVWPLGAPRFGGRWVSGGAPDEGCFEWAVRGLAGPAPAWLARANNLAVARGGRLVAAMSDGVLYTDDRGVTWRRARWESAHSPLSVAFDPGSDFGAAAGTNGSLWTTEDRGETWTLRRDSVGCRLVDVVALGRTVVWSDAAGGVWWSPDGGTSPRTLADVARRAMPTMALHDRAVWVLLEGAVWWRVAEGEAERAAP